MLQLTIGNKNYSSWSMRPWVLLKQASIPFEEVMLRFDDFLNESTYEQSKFKQTLRAITPVGKFPSSQPLTPHPAPSPFPAGSGAR